MAGLRSTDCERARASVSAWLDGELSEVGRARLDVHLVLCSACREFEQAARATTGLLRGTELAEPDFEVRMPRYRRPVARILPVGSAAAAVIAALALTGVLGLGQRGNQTAAPTLVGRPAASLSPMSKLRILSHDLSPQRRARLAQ